MNKKSFNQIKLALSLILILGVFANFPSQAQAQQPLLVSPTPAPKSITAPLSLQVSPPVAYLHVKPQETLRHTVMLKNTGTQALQITTHMTDFKADGKTGQPVLQRGQVFNKEINPELSFGEPFILQPDENRSINLELNVSQLAAEKEYPLAILFNAKTITDEGSKSNSTTQVAGTVASNLILFISESDENQGEIIPHQLKIPKLIDSFSGIKFQITAKNVGKNATPIVGRAMISNIFNQKIAEYIFYPDYVLADSTRLVRATALSPDILNSEGKLDPEKVKNLSTSLVYRPPLMFGLYNVEVQLGQQQRTVQVIAMPFSLVVVAGVGILIYVSYKKLLKES
jgi:hypothetical protein